MKKSSSRAALCIGLSITVFLGVMAYIPSSVSAAESQPEKRRSVPPLRSEPARPIAEPIKPGQAPSFLPAADAKPPATGHFKDVKATDVPPPAGLQPTGPAIVPEGTSTGFVEGKSTEDVSARRADAKVFDNPDGTQSVRVYSEPIHYEATKGEFADVDNNLVRTSTGFKNTAGPLQATLSASAASGTLATIDAGELGVTYALVGAADVKGVAERNTVTYREVRPGVDLRYEVFTGGLKDTVVLNRAPEAGESTELRFALSTRGLEPRS